VPKPIKSGIEFEAAFPVKGRILRAIMCECEAEGEIRIRVARDPKKGWKYDPKDPASFIDIDGYDPRDTYAKVRPGEWAEGRIICYGYLKRVRGRALPPIGSFLTSGTRLIGTVRVGDGVEIDFGLFHAALVFEDEEARARALRGAGLRHGDLVATDVGLDIELKRWGSKETILRAS
jgi:hypothetical protein